MWWMPWRLQAKKDVAACEKLRGAGKRALIRRYPNGETHPCLDDFRASFVVAERDDKSLLLKRVGNGRVSQASFVVAERDDKSRTKLKREWSW
jgi:hypothetical protein